MKQLHWVFVLLVMSAGCVEHDAAHQHTSKADEYDSLAATVEPSVKGDFQTYVHDLSMYNESYHLAIAPIIDTLNHTYQCTLLLTKKADTIFSQQVTRDILEQAILRDAEHSESSPLPADYELRKVIYHNTKSNNLYFIADMTSQDEADTLQILFQLPYRGQGIGTIFVNGINKEGW